jgi:mono/diheme cytochrome c family protein
MRARKEHTMRLGSLPAVSLFALLLALVSGCGDSSAQEGAREGDSARGLALFMAQGCVTCHSGSSMQGPSLDGIGDAYLKEAGGDLVEARDRVKAYVKDPRVVKPIVPRTNTTFSQMPAYPLMGDAELHAISEYILSISDGRKP